MREMPAPRALEHVHDQEPPDQYGEEPDLLPRHPLARCPACGLDLYATTKDPTRCPDCGLRWAGEEE